MSVVPEGGRGGEEVLKLVIYTTRSKVCKCVLIGIRISIVAQCVGGRGCQPPPQRPSRSATHTHTHTNGHFPHSEEVLTQFMLIMMLCFEATADFYFRPPRPPITRQRNEGFSDHTGRTAEGGVKTDICIM